MGFWRKHSDESTAPGFWQGLKKTRERMASVFQTQAFDASMWRQVEWALLTTDMGRPFAQSTVQALQAQCAKQGIRDVEGMWQALSAQLIAPLSEPAWVPKPSQTPQVIVLMGINGGGKTTASAKLAAWLQAQQCSVMLAAADTFRAAAIEQLSAWGDRLSVPVIKHAHGADATAVVVDAYQAACARGIDYVIADTAGRLHTQDHLMRELSKLQRVMGQKYPGAMAETWLVLDGTLGQSSLAQARMFQTHAPISGVVVTKLDGSAKGGMVFPVTEALNVPVRFIGVGEQVGDFLPFDAQAFVASLLPRMPA